MPNAYISNYVHSVFSTKSRLKTITPEIKERLWAYMGGIARSNGMKMLGVGGTVDHVHLLISLSATVPISKAVQLIKAGSSKWVHENFPSHSHFEWQAGYGAFSVSTSHIDDTIRYINKQEEHHSTKTFEEEFTAFLKKHELEYDERYVWG